MLKSNNVEALDTNVILRILLGDVPEQRQRALRLLSRPGVRYYISDQAVTETVHVLEGAGWGREQIVQAIERLLHADIFQFNYSIFNSAFTEYLRHPKLSLNDCYLAADTALQQAEPLWTFDKKLAVQNATAKLVG